MAQDKNLPKVETFVAKNTEISGNITSSEGTIRIDGSINGEIVKSHGIIVGEEGKLNTNIEANIIVIAGTINGNIKCLQKLELLNTAKILGNIETPLLTLNEGCVFEGNCKMTEKLEYSNKEEKAIGKEAEKLKEIVNKGDLI